MAEYIKCPRWFHHLPSIYKLIISFGVATIASALLMPVHMETMTRVMIGWDVFSVCMLIISVVIFTSMRPRQIRLLAKQEDAGRIVVFGIVLATTIGSLMGVMVLLGNKEFLLGKGLETFIYIAGVICSWFLLHTIFTYRYALLYYGDHPLDPDLHTVGLQIPNELWPDYLDFAYFAFVIGMTFQVSDIEISSRTIRRVALMHGILSFLFNTVIVALAINVVLELRG
jgi:uncharacterized membrane protein